MDDCMNGWTDGRMDGWMDGWREGWMDGWIDRWVDGCVCMRCIFVYIGAYRLICR
jgi:hypothetical protein